MSQTCGACGGQNKTGAGECAYCGSAFSTGKEVAVVWTAETGEGSRGKGKVAIRAPAEEAAERVSNLVEAAFSAAVDELGPKSSIDDIQAAMTKRLKALIPADTEIASLTLESYVPGRPPAEVVKGRSPLRVFFGLVIFMLGLGVFGCCGCFGGGFLAASMGLAQQAAQLKKARIVNADEAATARGLIALEGVTPEIDAPFVIPETDIACVYVEKRFYGPGASTHPDKMSSEELRVGELLVQFTPLTKFEGFEKLHEVREDKIRVVWNGIPVGRPITIVGAVEGDAELGAVMRSGAPFLVTTKLSVQEMVDTAEGAGAVTSWIGIVGLALGPLMMLLGLVIMIKR